MRRILVGPHTEALIAADKSQPLFRNDSIKLKGNTHGATDQSLYVVFLLAITLFDAAISPVKMWIPLLPVILTISLATASPLLTPPPLLPRDQV